MSFTIYTFNDGYPLYLLMNGLRAYFSSSTWGSLVFLAVSILTLIGVLTVQQRSLIGYGKAYAGPLLVYCLLFIPTAQLRIQNEWGGGAYSVDKMPIAIAIPLAVSSTVEKSLLDMVEQYVTPPNATSFRDFDFFMEAAALGEVLNGKSISNFETLGSIGRYYDDCVLKGISTGSVNESKYHRSSRLLIDSYMPWGVYFTEVTNPDGSKTVHTCKEAYNRLFGAVAGEAVSAGPAGMAAYLSTLFEGRHQNLADTMSALDSLANSLFPGHQSTSESLFQQAFMINGLESNLMRTSPQLAAAISQAEISQATGVTAAASVYIKKLPKLRAMIKLIIIGMLPIVGAFFLAQAARPFAHWSLALLAVSLWMPIMAIIKGTYIASAVAELHGMILPTGGLTLPNKGRVLSWIMDTSTVAGTLAFMIPAFVALVMQIIAPKLAGLASGVGAVGRGAEGFAQRAGMQALVGAERSARELELDKINSAFLEAGDTHLARNARMNELVGGHHNVAFARNTGTSPLQYGGTHTSAVMGQGYTISGGFDAQSSQLSQEAVALQQAKLEAAQSSAAYSLAMGNGVSKGTADFQRFENSLDQSQQKSFNEVQQAVASHVERVAASHGYSGEEVAQTTRALTAAVHAGVNFSSDRQMFGAIAGKLSGVAVEGGARGEAKAGVTTGEMEKATTATQAIIDAMHNDSTINSYSQSRSETLSEAQRMGTGEEWASRASRQEAFTTQMQKVDSAWTNLSATKTSMAQQQASLSANAGRNINTGDLIAVASRGDLEIMAMDSGMARLRGALDRGVTTIDDLRIAANADMSTLLRQADTGNGAALQSAMNGLDVIASSSQYNAQDAGIAKQILQDRSALSSMAHGSGLPSYGAAAAGAQSAYGGHAGGVSSAGSPLQSQDLGRPLQDKPRSGSGEALRGAFNESSADARAKSEQDRQSVHSQGMKEASGVSHLDPSRGTTVNAGKVLGGEAAEILDKLPGNRGD